MEEQNARRDLVLTGRELLKRKLTARTWGNISERTDGTHFVITPSGLDYMKTAEEDIVLYDMSDGTWEGKRRPSSEKGIHAAAYEIFPGVNFVIHTHQAYATAMGLYGWDRMEMSPSEREALGRLGRAAYGLPGQKSLCENVRTVLKDGATVVFMVNHGALILGSSMEDALTRAELLEEVCRRNVKTAGTGTGDAIFADELIKGLRASFPNVRACTASCVRARADSKKALPAGLDDMAQMIGGRLTVSGPDKVGRALRHRNAVLVPGVGAVVCGRDADDSEALCLLVEKAVMAADHAEANGVRAKLPAFDVLLMHAVYDLKYSGQKG